LIQVFGQDAFVFGQQVRDAFALTLGNQLEIIFDPDPVICGISLKATDQQAASHGVINVN
jgi:hypothetical protein